jgi:magnesium transporter
MRIDYKLINGQLHACDRGNGNVVIYADPTPAERQEILATLPIEEHTLDSMLDPDEISRAEFEEDVNVIIWKRACLTAPDSGPPTTSVGLILQKDRLTVIERERYPLPRDTHHTGPRTLMELVLRGMQESVHEFIRRLRTIKEISRITQARLTKTLDNSELLRMFDLSETLVFVVDAVDANGTVLRRLAANAKHLGLTDREIDLLDEVMIDNAQLSRQGHIYITIFAGLMDARGSIVNNNMNVLLRNLTIVNVVFLPLAVIAGMGGMSEFSMLLQHYKIPWQWGYPLFTLGLIVLGVLIGFGIRIWIHRMMDPCPRSKQ